MYTAVWMKSRMMPDTIPDHCERDGIRKMIELSDLTKKFDTFTAVDHLNLRIETGEFFGLLGPNGAGKTTTISLMSTLLLPTEGEIRVDGEVLSRKNPGLKTKDQCHYPGVFHASGHDDG